MFKTLVTSKYTLVTADFKSVELKFIEQGAEQQIVQDYKNMILSLEETKTKTELKKGSMYE